MTTEREAIEFDVLIVGGGPAGLSCAIRLMQLAQKTQTSIEVAVIDKGGEMGSHAVSGAVVKPDALAELLPDHMAQGCPVESVVREDAFYFMTADKAVRLPFAPYYMRNKGCYIMSQARLAHWLAGIAEEMGVNLFPGFAGTQILYGEDGRTVIGVRTGDKGLDKEGRPKANFEPGIDLLAKVTVLAEGARGSLVKSMAGPLGLFKGAMPDVFETGIKEVIQLPAGPTYFSRNAANDIHVLGYPLGLNVAGGGFIYEMADNCVSVGYLTALSYSDPMLDPYEMLIRFKRHPFVAGIIRGGKVVEQGARTVSAGGYFAMPGLVTDGALLVGACASIHNGPAIKGIHLAMQSGMLAAETIVKALAQEDTSAVALNSYTRAVEESSIKTEMWAGRNHAQALAKKAVAKFFHLGLQYFTSGTGLIERMPLEDDADTLKPLPPGFNPPASRQHYDGELYVDKLTGVYLSKTMHREDQPPHLIIHDPQICSELCYPRFRAPCIRFCPGQVYELELDAKGRAHIKLNPSNCFHCKTCDIKDPYHNITWTCPEGGEGPVYTVV